jgi:CRP-like cAMP-binding protein
VTSKLITKLEKLRFLSVCSNNLLELLATCGVLRRYKRDEYVYVQDSDPKGAYVIVFGIVNRESIQDSDVVVQHSRAFAGDWLGLANITSQPVPYLHSAIAADTSDILSFDIQKFAILRANPEFSLYLLQVAGRERIAEEERYLNNHSSSRSYDKLVRFLAAEMARQHKSGFPMLKSPYIVGTQKYLAEAIGATRETVSRDLQPLIEAGILKRSQQVRPIGYLILNEEELKALADSSFRRSVLYENTRNEKLSRRYSDVA